MRLLLCLLIICAGCQGGAEQPKRGNLGGQVTLNGKPLAGGTIRFMALDPNGINVLATVKDGAYVVDESQGPTKGKYRVEFSVLSSVKQRVPNDDIPGQFMEIAPETLPPRYHRNSTITLDYDPATPKAFDYSLTAP